MNDIKIITGKMLVESNEGRIEISDPEKTTVLTGWDIDGVRFDADNDSSIEVVVGDEKYDVTVWKRADDTPYLSVDIKLPWTEVTIYVPKNVDLTTLRYHRDIFHTMTTIDILTKLAKDTSIQSFTVNKHKDGWAFSIHME